MSAQTRRAVAALLFAAALAGCGSSPSGGGSAGTTSSAAAAASSATSTATSSATGTAASGTVITIKNFTFQTPASVSPGATVTVTNQDTTAHTVTADSGNAFNDQAPPGNSTFKAPTKPGSYPFHCSIHPFMTATLVVK